MQDLKSFLGVIFCFEHKGWSCQMCESMRQKCGHTIENWAAIMIMADLFLRLLLWENLWSWLWGALLRICQLDELNIMWAVYSTSGESRGSMYLEGRREYKSIGLSGLLHSIMTLVVEISSLVFKTYRVLL